MGVISALRSLTRSFAAPFSQHDRIDWTSPDFQPIDVIEIARHLNLETWGRRNGVAELPATADTQFDGPQQRIVHYVRSLSKANIASARAEIIGHNERIGRIDLSGLVDELRHLPERARHELSLAVAEARAAVRDEQRRLRDAERQLDLFRERTGLDREAVYPDSRTFHVAAAAAIGLAESGLNAYFFALGHEYGLVGGLWFSIVLAATDMVLCFVLGRFAAALLSPAWRHRALGLASGVIGLLWAGGYNLLVAHFREALQLAPFGEAARLAVRDFWSEPLGLSAFDSWFLFLLGLMFSIAALGTGWRADDPVPGYGRRDRRLRQLREDRVETEKDFRQRLSEKLSDIRARIDRIVRQGEARLEALEHYIRTKQTLLQNVEAYVRMVQESANALLAIYRDANRRARATPPPTYFQADWQYELPEVLRDDTTRDDRRLDRQRQLLMELREARNDSHRQIDAIADELDIGPRAT